MATRIELNEEPPVSHPPYTDRARAVDAEQLRADLARVVRGEVRFDRGSRALYATDGSNYRQPPIGVVIPRDTDDVIRAVDVCRAHEAPIFARGGGTSLAGQCCNVAVVFDFSKYMNRVIEVDPVRRLARVEPGTILDDLRHAAETHGLTFGPDPYVADHAGAARAASRRTLMAVAMGTVVFTFAAAVKWALSTRARDRRARLVRERGISSRQSTEQQHGRPRSTPST
jgi:hypothetical protein